jgi:hypothetical protein
MLLYHVLHLQRLYWDNFHKSHLTHQSMDKNIVHRHHDRMLNTKNIQNDSSQRNKIKNDKTKNRACVLDIINI